MKANRLHLVLIGLVLLLGCKPVSQIVTGEDAYKYKRYPEAVSLLEAEIEKSKEDDVKARKSYWIGESYRLMNQDKASVKWYRKAYELSKNQISLEAYAIAVLRSQQYGNAKKLYQKLIKLYGQNEAWNLAIESCDAAKLWISEQNPNKYIIKRAKSNSATSDYSPVFYENILVFTSDRSESKGDDYHWTGNQFTDFYRLQEDNKLDALLYKINSPFNEASIAFDQTLTKVAYTQCGSSEESSAYDRCRLIEGEWDEDQKAWVNFKKLSFCQEGVSYGHPTFFNYGQGLIFSSNDPDGLGGFDLYVSYSKNEEWSAPVMLPPGLNTTSDEKFPVMIGDSLFYSSDGLVGMGGLDIYMSKFVAPDGWTTPKNLKPPVNSGGDDFGFTFDPRFKQQGSKLSRFYISSNRPGSKQDDIYVFEEMRTVKDTTKEEEPAFVINIEGKVLEQLYETEGDPNSRKMGTRPLPGASVVVDDDRLLDVVVGEDGTFKYTLTDEKAYRFVADKKGYLSNSNTVNVKLTEKETRQGGKTYIVHILLDPIVYNKEIVMDEIYYDFDKWDIREDARPSLEELAKLLQDNPSIKIELASHTDCRGPEIYNAELSQRRATSAVTYLAELGIEKRRMRAAGYGEQKPALSCLCDECDEDQHQANRRTSFTILSD